MNIEDMIDSVGKGDNIGAGKAYDTVIAAKLSAAMDAKKIEIASTMGKTSEVDSEEQ